MAAIGLSQLSELAISRDRSTYRPNESIDEVEDAALVRSYYFVKQESPRNSACSHLSPRQHRV